MIQMELPPFSTENMKLLPVSILLGMPDLASGAPLRDGGRAVVLALPHAVCEINKTPASRKISNSFSTSALRLSAQSISFLLI